MSYRCDNCKKIVLPGKPMHKVIAETRSKIYEYVTWDKNGFVSKKYARGFEIVSEKHFCFLCFKEGGEGRS